MDVIINISVDGKGNVKVGNKDAIKKKKRKLKNGMETILETPNVVEEGNSSILKLLDV